MSTIHYKFRSSTDYDSIKFDGQSISLNDLRDAIMTQKKITKSPAYTLEITNAQTKEVYNVDDAMVQKNSSVIIRRVPFQRLEDVTDASGLSKEEAELTEMALAKLSTTANLADAKASEDDKIKAMLQQSAQGFEPSTYQRKPPVAPANYTCYRCNGKGHFVRQCPTHGDPRFNQRQFQRAPSGIPKEFYLMKIKKEDELLNSLRLMKGNNQFTPAVSSDVVDHSKVPENLLCPLCQKLFKDAVVTPCCGESFCDDCIRNHLLEMDLECKCGETTSPDNLIANKSLRNAVNNFRNQKPTKSVSESPMIQANSNSNGPSYLEEDMLVPSPKPPTSESILPTENGSNGVSYLNVPSPAVPTDGNNFTDSPKRMVDATPMVATSVTDAFPSNSLPGATQLPVSGPPQHMMLSSNYPSSAAPAIYTNVQGTARPTYTNVIPGPTLIQQPPGVVHLPMPAGLPAGTQFVQQRLVPVAVPSQRYMAPTVPAMHIARVGNIPLDIGQRLLDSGPSSRVNQLQRSGSGASRRRDEIPLPLSEDEFYKLQLKSKHRPRHRSRSRSRSPGSDNKRSRRRRHRSGSANDSGGGKGRYDSPADDSSQERKLKKKKKRHRDSSQESLKDKNDKKSKRRIPEHIKREVDEFDFDNELEFDEELRKLKSKKNNRDGNLSENENVSSPTTADQQNPSRSRSHSASKEPEIAASLETPAEETEPKVEASKGEGANDATIVKTEESDLADKPKRKTKIIKKKVIRVTKVARKKGSEDKIISQTVIEKDADSASTSQQENVEKMEEEDGEISGNINEEEEDNEEIEQPAKKAKVETTHKSPGSSRRALISAKSAKNMTPEKKRELMKKRLADEKSATKAKELLSAVRAKKEAEKRELLQGSGKKDELDAAEEKKRKYERYMLSKKRAKEKLMLEKKRAATSKSSTGDRRDSKLKSISDESKKQLQQKSESMRSKVSSVTPEKRRRAHNKVSAGEEDNDEGSSQSSDEKSRRVVRLDSRHRGPVSKVEKRSHEREGSREHHKQRDDERRRREREREYEQERENERERKRLHKLEKEKDEMVEQQRQAMKENERLGRKLEKERQLRKEMEREREREEEEQYLQRKRDEEKRKRKMEEHAEAERETRVKRSRRKESDANVIEIDVSDHDDRMEESETVESEEQKSHEKKKKKKSKKKKKEKKKKKREEESEESEAESSDDEDEKSKKKKRKHKKKHRKHSKKSKKHKKKSSKKKKKKQKDDESEAEENEDETVEDETTTVAEDEDEDDHKESDEEDGSASDSKDGSEGSSSPEKDAGSKASTSDDDDEVEDGEISETKESSPSEETTSKSEVKADDKKKASPKVTVGETKKRRRSTIADDDIELDYDDKDGGNADEAMTEDALLYGDLGLIDDEQTNPDSASGDKTTTTAEEEYEEGEIPDDEDLLLGITKKKSTGIDKMEDINEAEDDTEIDDAINNAMSIEGLDIESEATVEEISDQNEATASSR